MGMGAVPGQGESAVEMAIRLLMKKKTLWEKLMSGDDLSKTYIPGIKAKHKIVTPDCVKLHGGSKAMTIALGELEVEYHQLKWADANKDAKWHAVLTVERPQEDSLEVHDYKVREFQKICKHDKRSKAKDNDGNEYEHCHECGKVLTEESEE